jgi:hypothetical protein
MGLSERVHFLENPARPQLKILTLQPQILMA